MRSRRVVALASCVLLAGACTSAPDGDVTLRPSPSATDIRVGRFQVTGDCAGFGRARGPQIAFVVDGRVLVGSPRLLLSDEGDAPEGDLRCVLEDREAADVVWGPAADRFHLGDLRRHDGRDLVTHPGAPESISWSRPTGRSVVFVNEGRLMKIDAFGRKPFEISFLDDHDEVAYHPAGTHIAVTGTHRDGTYGVWLATNLGEEAQLLAVGEDALRIYSMGWSHDGTTLYYAAEHDDRFDVHALRLALNDVEGVTREARLDTLDSSTEELGDVVVSEFAEGPEEAGGRIAYTRGTCAGRKTTLVWDAGEITELGGPLADASTEPVGWLPGGELVLFARRGCPEDEPAGGTVYVWTTDETVEVVEGASAASVRTVLPPPPGPPGSRQEVIA